MTRAPDPAVELLPLPPRGRRVTRTRPVRLGDVTPRGRLRLDALARYLHDVAGDDADEGRADDSVATAEATTWVVRRTMARYLRAPVFREPLELTTWCAGYGSRWAERRTSVTGARGGHIEAVSLWVHVDLESGRPTRLAPSFEERWAESHGGRKVSARLRLPEVPEDRSRIDARPWPLRLTDMDVLDHVNNAAYWAPVEEVLTERSWGGRFDAEIEYGSGIPRGTEVTLLVEEADRAFTMWLDTPAGVAGAARVTSPPR